MIENKKLIQIVCFQDFNFPTLWDQIEIPLDSQQIPVFNILR